MPLIVLSGYPCTGKTTFASQLSESLRASGAGSNIVVINEESLHMNKSEYFKDALHEKILRQNIKSSVDHALNADTYVIIDSLNYIKGFRYELFCIARSQRTPHCVVLVECDYSTSVKWNEERAELGYDSALMQDLRRRFERPNSANRWDKPLFVVNTTPTSGSESTDTCKDDRKGTQEQETEKITQQEEGSSDVGATVFSSSWTSSKSRAQRSFTPSVSGASRAASSTSTSGVFFSGSMVSDQGAAGSVEGGNPAEVIEQIIQYFKTAEVPAPNAATVQVKHAGAELLYQLDRVSQTVTQLIVTHQQKHSDGTPLVLKDFNSQTLTLPRHVGVAELQRLRRQFVKVNSQHPPENSVDVGEKFVEFLINQL